MSTCNRLDLEISLGSVDVSHIVLLIMDSKVFQVGQNC